MINKNNILWCYLTIAVYSLAMLISCSEKTPEEEIMAFLTESKQLVEKKSMRGLRKLVSDRYRDNSGMAKSDILRIAAGYFMQKQSIYIVYEVDDISFSADGKSSDVTLYAAVSDSSLSKDDPRLLQAEFHRLQFHLEKTPEWQCTSLDWQSSTSDAFLNVKK